MKKVYIDVGCHNGQSIHEFYNWYSLVDPEATEYEIWGIDPLLAYRKLWEDLNYAHPKAQFINKAAWIEDGWIPFSEREMHRDQGSSVMESKRDYDKGQVREVQSFDFSEWLKQFKDHDFVIVKMDIEGAEYPILKKMIKDGTDKLVDLLLVEWHDHKMSGDFGEQRQEILKRLHCKVSNWS